MKTKPKRARGDREARAEVATADPALPVALLRIALALKMHPDRGLDAIIEDTAKSMRISREDLRGYLAHHMALLAQAATDRPARRKASSVVVSTPSQRPRIKVRSPR